MAVTVAHRGDMVLIHSRAEFAGDVMNLPRNLDAPWCSRARGPASVSLLAPGLGLTLDEERLAFFRRDKTSTSVHQA